MSIKKKSKFPSSQQIGTLLLLLAGGIFVVNSLLPRKASNSLVLPMEYSKFIKQVEKQWVKKATITDDLIQYELTVKGREQLKKDLELLALINQPDLLESLDQPEQTLSQEELKQKRLVQGLESQWLKTLQWVSDPSKLLYLSTTPINDPELASILRANDVIFSGKPPTKENAWLRLLFNWVIPPLIFVTAFRFFMKRDDQGSLSINKSKAKVYVEGEFAQVTFADVAGVEEAKAELVEIVEFLKQPQKFNEIGAKIPKGVLLVGSPGTGKTLLAKAVAGEARVSFFSISASEFVELFVGTGAARVRDLFEQAKKQAPCIIFIDELDAIGKSRSTGGTMSGGSDEREQTLNQLLTEMDGFGVGDATVIVLAATNRPETLDAALLRPGRFDRQVLVDRPDLSGRLQILTIYAQKVKLGEDVDLQAIATRTPGFAGAELANLVNEAALLAARNQRATVAQGDFLEAIERVVAGLEKKNRVLNDHEKKVVAYHEVGHALVGAVMPGGGEVAKISIVPRGMSALGYTLKMPTEDRFLLNESELRDQIATLLGGRAAEEIIFGSVTTGASGDLQKATSLAEKMVTTYGMSKVLGPLAYDKPQGNNFLGGGAEIRRNVSDSTAKAIDAEIKEIVETGHQQALNILNHNRDLMETITLTILEKEVIEGEELQTLLSQVQLTAFSNTDSILEK